MERQRRACRHAWPLCAASTSWLGLWALRRIVGVRGSRAAVASRGVTAHESPRGQQRGRNLSSGCAQKHAHGPQRAAAWMGIEKNTVMEGKNNCEGGSTARAAAVGLASQWEARLQRSAAPCRLDQGPAYAPSGGRQPGLLKMRPDMSRGACGQGTGSSRVEAGQAPFLWPSSSKPPALASLHTLLQQLVHDLDAQVVDVTLQVGAWCWWRANAAQCVHYQCMHAARRLPARLPTCL